MQIFKWMPLRVEEQQQANLFQQTADYQQVLTTSTLVQDNYTETTKIAGTKTASEAIESMHSNSIPPIPSLSTNNMSTLNGIGHHPHLSSEQQHHVQQDNSTNSNSIDTDPADEDGESLHNSPPQKRQKLSPPARETTPAISTCTDTTIKDEQMPVDTKVSLPKNQQNDFQLSKKTAHELNASTNSSIPLPKQDSIDTPPPSEKQRLLDVNFNSGAGHEGPPITPTATSALNQLLEDVVMQDDIPVHHLEETQESKTLIESDSMVVEDYFSIARSVTEKIVTDVSNKTSY